MAEDEKNPKSEHPFLTRREGMENSCRVVIQGLSPNADIPGHANNDLPRPYAT
ncbi:hypothetical protein Tco_0354194, partial [Tanacetum coccineum]